MVYAGQEVSGSGQLETQGRQEKLLRGLSLGGPAASGNVCQTEISCGNQVWILTPHRPSQGHSLGRHYQDGSWGTQNQAEVSESRGGS